MTSKNLKKISSNATLLKTNHIKAIEGIFFLNRADEQIDYRKINVNSSYYSKNYDANIRRKEIYNLYILDEIISDTADTDFNIIEIISHIENQLIEFNTTINSANIDIAEIHEKLRTLQKKVEEALVFLGNNISNEQYLNCLNSYNIASPPVNKTLFIEATRRVNEIIDKNLHSL